MANWAVVIGIDKYWSKSATLKGAVRDALAFGEWLEKSGAVPSANIYYVLGPNDEEAIPPGITAVGATQADFVNTINHVNHKSRLKGDVFYFYYAGHGIARRQDSRDEDALVPQDFTDTNPIRSFSLSSLRDFFTNTEYDTQFFFIDACRNIPWVGEFVIGAWPTPRPRDLTHRQPQQFVIYATSPGVKSREIGLAGNERGAFTQTLIAGLEGQAKTWDMASGQEVVRFNELFKFVEKGVRELKVAVPDETEKSLIQIPVSDRRSDRGENPILAKVTAQPIGLIGKAYEALEGELNRIDQLIRSPGNNGPLRDEETIRQKFRPHLGDLRERLREIRRAIEQQDFVQAWRGYGEARNQHLPALANDLLATIGGVYLRNHHVDDPGIAPGSEGRLWYSNLAQTLVEDDLADRTRQAAHPVLIVGEERSEVSGAVIRLRFPAWDIWNLPLTAHEYGYLLALRATEKKEVRQLDDFLTFCGKIQVRVDPRSHSPPTRPEASGCFLNEVQQFWQSYYEDGNEERRTQFVERHQRRLALLQQQQTRFVCRLFADAFATLFGGPAYLYSLLYLRFWPNEVSPPDMPPFADRFVFALGILERMRDRPMVYQPVKYRGQFDDVLKSLQSRWDDARAAAGLDATHDGYQRERYKDWIDEVYGCFERYKAEIEKTYDFWMEAKGLSSVLRSANHKVSDLPTSRPAMWTVLNAAWRAREDASEQELMHVVPNALRLLDANDTSLIQPPPSRAPSQARRPGAKRPATS